MESTELSPGEATREETDTASPTAPVGGEGAPNTGDAASDAAFERYARQVEGAVRAYAGAERLMGDLWEEGFPTKISAARAEELMAAFVKARDEAVAGARGLQPAEPQVASLHARFEAAVEQLDRVAEGFARADEHRRAERWQEALQAVPHQEATEHQAAAQEWVSAFHGTASGTSADLSPMIAASDLGKRSAGFKLRRFARQLIRPFMPYMHRVTLERLFVVPFKEPYGPMSPPGMRERLARIPVVRLIARSQLASLVALLLTFYYWAAVALWWLSGWGVLVSLVAWGLRSLRVRGQRGPSEA